MKRIMSNLKLWCRIVGHIKTPKILEIGQWVRLCEATLPKSGNFWYFGVPHSHPRVPIEVKFCTVKPTQMPIGPAKFDLNLCNESLLRGKKTDFWPVSKFNIGSLPLYIYIYTHHNCLGEFFLCPPHPEPMGWHLGVQTFSWQMLTCDLLAVANLLM